LGTEIEHALEPAEPLRIGVHEGIVEDYREASVVVFGEDLGHRQS
jgi:hypothetical protein